MSQRYLLTGATGFVGANLAHHLVKAGHDVHIVTRATSPLWRLAEIARDLTIHTVDLLDAPGLDRLLTDLRPSQVWHQATYGGFVGQDDARRIAETNFLGLVNLLTAAMRVGFEGFINTGSSSEYGPKAAPMNELDLPAPQSPYGASKAGATLYAQALGMSRQLPIYTLRLFSPYGPYDDPTRLIPTVVDACLARRSPSLFSPAPVRDYVYIDDVVAIYEALAPATAAPGSIFNVGSGRQVSVGEVAGAIARLTDCQTPPTWQGPPPRAGEPQSWQADIEKARQLLGWQPQHSLEQGLQATIAWHRAHAPTAGRIAP